jgi:hypothetical protein
MKPLPIAAREAFLDECKIASFQPASLFCLLPKSFHPGDFSKIYITYLVINSIADDF